MINILSFLKNNSISIAIASLTIFILLVIFSAFNNDFSDVPPFDHKDKSNTSEDQEGFDSPANKNTKDLPTEDLPTEDLPTEDLPTESLPQAFCEKYNGQPAELNKKCKLLSANTCKVPSCCVLRNGNDCVAGDKHGPFYLKSDTEYYIHKDQCKGKCSET